MSLRRFMLVPGMLCLLALWSGHASAGEKAARAEVKAEKPAAKPQVEVVFCLDTTGSMSGLIDVAKKKIWSISNQIASGKPTPALKVGLVAYRDRGDSYITKVFDLSDDLDSIHGHLMGFTANEGGDEPESVNQALFDAVHKITWSKDKKTLKMIFLVGDAPPHMDYPDDVKYPDTCKEAVKRDIIINTVLCGSSATAKDHWLKICRLAEGSFVQIDAAGGPVVAIATPFDKELAEISVKFSTSTLVYGGDKAKAEAEKRVTESAALPLATAAPRAAYLARTDGGATAYDLIKGIKDGKVKLEELKKEELPKELVGKNLTEQKQILEKLDKEREVLSKRALELEKMRNEFIAKKIAEDTKLATPTSFENEVLGILRVQAGRRSGIAYDVAEPKKK
ncbi:MAG: vWA domain-containing protein [Gemmataceae bacterium]